MFEAVSGAGTARPKLIGVGAERRSIGAARRRSGRFFPYRALAPRLRPPTSAGSPRSTTFLQFVGLAAAEPGLLRRTLPWRPRSPVVKRLGASATAAASLGASWAARKSCSAGRHRQLLDVSGRL